MNRTRLGEWGVLVLVWLSLVALFGMLAERFLSMATLTTVAGRLPGLAVVAAGMTLVIIAGGIDLSVGSVMALAGAVLGVAIVQGGWPLAAAIPGAVDAHVHQRLDAPALNMQMDRTRLQQVGLSAANVGQNVLISLSGSSQTAPAFWLNPQNGVVYNIAVQTPQYQIDSLDTLLNKPVVKVQRALGGVNARKAAADILERLKQRAAAAPAAA